MRGPHRLSRGDGGGRVSERRQDIDFDDCSKCGGQLFAMNDCEPDFFYDCDPVFCDECGEVGHTITNGECPVTVVFNDEDVK